MLDRHVDVRERARLRELPDEPVRDVRRMQVEVAEPRDRRLGERQEQIAEVRPSRAARQILPPRQGVLRDEHHFLDAVAGERLDLRHHVGQRAAPVPPAHQRDRAEGAAHVAPFGDLHVGVGLAAETHPRHVRPVHVSRGGGRHPGVAGVQPADHVHDPWQLARAHERVDLGHLGEELGPVALGQAAGDHQAAAGRAALPGGELQDGLDRFLLGPVDERAGVDDDAVGGLGLGHRSHPVPGQAGRASARRRPDSSGSRGSRDGRSWQRSSIASGPAAPGRAAPRPSRGAGARRVRTAGCPRRRSGSRAAARRARAGTARRRGAPADRRVPRAGSAGCGTRDRACGATRG